MAQALVRICFPNKCLGHWRSYFPRSPLARGCASREQRALCEREIQSCIPNGEMAAHTLLNLAKYPNLSDRPIAEWDVAGLLKAMWEAWNSIFKKTLGHAERALESGGESAAAGLVVRMGSKAEPAREPAYRLYVICERKKRAKEALSYNAWCKAGRRSSGWFRRMKKGRFSKAFY